MVLEGFKKLLPKPPIWAPKGIRLRGAPDAGHRGWALASAPFGAQKRCVARPVCPNRDPNGSLLEKIKELIY